MTVYRLATAHRGAAILLALFATILLAPERLPAQTTGTLTLPGTGFDMSGNPLTSGSSSGGTDAWWFIHYPSGTYAPAYFIAPGNADWFFNYAANTNAATFQGSGWISDNATSDFNGPVPYTFFMTFDLSSFVPGTVTITGNWSVADTGVLGINGHVIAELASHNNPWTTLHSFSITNSSYLNAGLNRMEIQVSIADQVYEAARFEGTATGTLVAAGTAKK